MKNLFFFGDFLKVDSWYTKFYLVCICSFIQYFCNNVAFLCLCYKKQTQVVCPLSQMTSYRNSRWISVQDRTVMVQTVPPKKK